MVSAVIVCIHVSVCVCDPSSASNMARLLKLDELLECVTSPSVLT